jgi:hypothetical protein
MADAGAANQVEHKKAQRNEKQNAPALHASMVQNHDLLHSLVQWLLQKVLEAEMTDALAQRCQHGAGRSVSLL